MASTNVPPLKAWELDNNVQLVDPKRDALYKFDLEANKAETADRPWTSNVNYFKRVRISATALIKMVMHARSGGSIEVMGLMMGYINGDAFIVTDAFRLPVEGTETRVNAHSDAEEYMVDYLSSCRDQGRQENVVGWYHSHPGYGCWLSGIDVMTQVTHQTYQDPFLAVVIDPDRTISAGKVEIGAFRTYPMSPEGQNKENHGTGGAGSGSAPGGDAAPDGGGGSSGVTADGWQAVPLAKAAEFGAHASKYYSLEVSHYKSTLDSQLLELLWHKYWVQTLSQNPLLTNRDYGNKQMLDLASKIREATTLVSRHGRLGNGVNVAGDSASLRGGGAGFNIGGVVPGGAKRVDAAIDGLLKDCNSVAAQEKSGLAANEVKAQLFNGLGPAAASSSSS